MAARGTNIGEAALREVAVAASADPRTVARVLRGERVRGMADTRIRRELAARGIVPKEPSADENARAQQRASMDRAMGLTTPVRGSRHVGTRQTVGAHELSEATARRLNELDDDARPNDPRGAR